MLSGNAFVKLEHILRKQRPLVPHKQNRGQPGEEEETEWISPLGVVRSVFIVRNRRDFLQEEWSKESMLELGLAAFLQFDHLAG